MRMHAHVYACMHMPPHGQALFDSFKEGILTKLDGLQLPPAALDALIDFFGASNVAEMTGRSHRLLRTTASGGRVEYTLTARAEKGAPQNKINLRERARFQSGRR